MRTVQQRNCSRDAGSIGLLAGGYAPTVANVMTANDVLALTHLGVSDGLSPLTTAVLVERQPVIAGLLSRIPQCAMHEVSSDKYEAVYGRKSDAWQLWDLLRTCAGRDRWVVSNKLLARKQPYLVPVYDSVVKKILGRPVNVWACFWSWFS